MTKARASEAFDLLKAGRDKDARAMLESIVKDDLADNAVLETLGDLREKLGDRAGALDSYGGAVTHLRARGELRRALAVIELMLLVDDRHLWSRLEGADIRWELEDDAGCWRELVVAVEILVAKNDIRSALRLAAQYADALPDAAPALELSKALTHAARAPGTHVPGTNGARVAHLCVELGNALRRRDKPDDALALYLRALEVAPQLREAQHARAGGLLATGRTAEARVVVDQILALDPSDLVALSLLERIAGTSGDTATASSAGDRFDREPAHDALWAEDTAELTISPEGRPDTEDDPTDLER